MSFIVITVTEEIEKQAQKIREERDVQYGNIYEVEDTDLRWVGEVGEICFHQWAQNNTTLPIEWITDKAAGRPDFLIGGSSIDVKTVKRKVKPQPDYTAQITAKHANESVEYFFFMSYEFLQHKLWLLGGITKQDFLANAVYFKAGDKVHENYMIRKGHEIYNIKISKLISPQNWIGSLQ